MVCDVLLSPAHRGRHQGVGFLGCILHVPDGKAAHNILSLYKEFCSPFWEHRNCCYVKLHVEPHNDNMVATAKAIQANSEGGDVMLAYIRSRMGIMWAERGCGRIDLGVKPFHTEDYEYLEDWVLTTDVRPKEQSNRKRLLEEPTMAKEHLSSNKMQLSGSGNPPYDRFGQSFGFWGESRSTLYVSLGWTPPRIPASIPTQYRLFFTVVSWLQYRRSQSFSGLGPGREYRDEYRRNTDTGIERCIVAFRHLEAKSFWRRFRMTTR